MRSYRKLAELSEEEKKAWRRKQIREASARFRAAHRDEINRKRRETRKENKA